VRNLLGSVSDSNFSGWTAIGAPSGSTSGSSITFTGSGNDWRYGNYLSGVVPVIVGHIYRVSFTVGQGTKTGTIVIRDGSNGIGGSLVINLLPTPTRYSFLTTGINGITGGIGFDNRVSVGGDGIAGTIICTNFMIEDVTGQTNQNPSEYVSVGVLAAPYQGAGVDGIQFFSTLNGNTTSSNVVTSGTGAAIKSGVLGSELVTNGDFSNGTTGWTTISSGVITGGILSVVAGALRIQNDATGTNYGAASTPITCIVGGTYTVSVTRVGGTGSGYMIVGTSVVFGTVNNILANQTATSFSFVATATTHYIGVQAGANTANQYYDFDNISVKQVLVPSTAPVDASGPLGYLSEGSRVNLCLQSSTFQTSWSIIRLLAFGSGSTVDAIAGPDGALTADLITEDTTATNTHVIQQTFTDTAATTYTFSVYFKPNGRTWFALSDGGASNYAYFNASANGTVGTKGAGVAAGAAVISLVSNGWYRASITYTGTGVASPHAVLLSSADGTSSYTGNGVSGAYVWGAQLEQASFASTYIPTATTAVTRAADVLTYPSAGNVSGTVGTAYAEVAIPYAAGAANQQLLSFGSPFSSLGVLATTNVLYLYDGTGVRSGNTFTPSSTIQKAAYKWTVANSQTFIGGVASSLLAFDGDLNITANMTIASDSVGATQPYGTLRNVRIYGTALSSAQLQALTSP
jgi:hypothetical protein